MLPINKKSILEMLYGYKKISNGTENTVDSMTCLELTA